MPNPLFRKERKNHFVHEGISTNQDLEISFMGLKGATLALALLTLMAIIVYKDYLFFGKLFIFTGVANDSCHFLYPYLYNNADNVSRYGIPTWSFRAGMGQNISPFFLRDPFDLLLIYAGKKNILRGIAITEVTKVVLAGLTFYYYLKQLRLSDFAALAGCFFYAFSGFIIVGSCWNIFSFEALELALLLLAFELMFSARNYLLLPISIFFFCISQPFNLYVYGLFIGFYVLLRLVHTNTFSFKRMLCIYLRMAALGAIGALLSGPILSENLLGLLESPRGSGLYSNAAFYMSQPVFGMIYKFPAGTALLHFFSSDMLGPGSRYNGWWNYLEAPLFYCGIPCLLLMPQVFTFLSSRAKIFFALFLLVWLLPVVFPWFKYAFWLFTGDYFRAYSLFVSCIFMYYSVHALDSILKTRKVNIWILLISVTVLFSVLNFDYYPSRSDLMFPEVPALNPTIYSLVSVLIVVYALLIFFLTQKISYSRLRVVFMLLLIGEVTYLSAYSLGNMKAIRMNELAEKKGYNDYSADAVAKIKQSDTSFYRIDKLLVAPPVRYAPLNEGMIQEYRGTSSYNQFNQLYYILYLRKMGLIDPFNEPESRWSNGLLNFPIPEAENSVKYLLTNTSMPEKNVSFYDTLACQNGIYILRNKYVLPFGYTYKKVIPEREFKQLSTSQKALVSLMACMIPDSLEYLKDQFTVVHASDSIVVVSPGFYAASCHELMEDTLKTDQMTDVHITGRIHASADKILYLSVPFDRGWHINIDGREQRKLILNGGMTGVALKGGDHFIDMHFEHVLLKKGLFGSLIGLIIYFLLWRWQVRKLTLPVRTL